MNLEMEPGRYILAVSGGVDSMVLLDLLSQRKDVELIVAHFDHGIREESAEDAAFVSSVANKYGLRYEGGEGKLGEGASEETARTARYEFLLGLKAKHRADAVVTAHHQDDLIETAIINILRGTGHRGLSAISSNNEILRPMLGISKKAILNYAAKNKIQWHEDKTNSDTKYLRNYIRQNLLPGMGGSARTEVLENIHRATIKRHEIDELLEKTAGRAIDSGNLNRVVFASMPHEVSTELLTIWLRKQGIRDLTTKNINELTIGAKTAKPGTKKNVKQGSWLMFDAEYVTLKKPD